jgi:hypothetical protein
LFGVFLNLVVLGYVTDLLNAQVSLAGVAVAEQQHLKLLVTVAICGISSYHPKGSSYWRMYAT